MLVKFSGIYKRNGRWEYKVWSGSVSSTTTFATKEKAEEIRSVSMQALIQSGHRVKML